MSPIWDAFLEDYKEHISNWPIRYLLEAFWHYNYNGSIQCDKFLAQRKPRATETESRELLEGVYYYMEKRVGGKVKFILCR